jgi:SagB-type dehydrogenase family enzyme
MRMNFYDTLQALECHVGLTEDARAAVDGENGLELPKAYLPLLPYVQRMNSQPVPLSELIDDIMSHQSFMALPLFYSMLGLLSKKGWLIYSIQDVLEVRPSAENWSVTEISQSEKISCGLSEYAFLRKTERGMRLETPLNAVIATIVSHDLLGALYTSKEILLEPLNTGFSAAENRTAALYMLYLFSFLTASGKSDELLKQWEFHDLLLHSRSRYGRHTGQFGATYRFRDKIPSLPPIKPVPEHGTPIFLERADMERLKTSGPSFFSVVENRCSTREFASNSITLSQLGTLLYATSRIEGTRYDTYHEVTKRPYPNGGSIYELEIYITAISCDGLEQGVYHFHPGSHALYKVSSMSAKVQRMVSLAEGMAQNNRLQILITLSARFQRVSWKYETLAYTLILKNTGVLLHHIGLAATALGLGSCILGSGDSDTLAEILESNFYVESAVGEIVLGTIKTGNK